MNIERMVKDGTGGVFRFDPDSDPRGLLPAGTVPDRLTVDTSEVATKESFLGAMSAALQFPDYFGYNWDAFYDCLSESVENFEGGLILTLTNLTRFVSEQPDEFAAALAAMRDAAEYWQRAGRTLLVLIGIARSCPVDKLDEIPVT